MAKQIDPIKRAKVKKSLLEGNSAKQALLDGGYTPATAEHSTGMTVVTCSQQEIIDELKLQDLDSAYFIKKMERLVINATDNPDTKRKGIVDQARFAGVDKQIEQNTINVYSLTGSDKLDPEALTRMAKKRSVGV